MTLLEFMNESPILSFFIILVVAEMLVEIAKTLKNK